MERQHLVDVSLLMGREQIQLGQSTDPKVVCFCLESVYVCVINVKHRV